MESKAWLMIGTTTEPEIAPELQSERELKMEPGVKAEPELTTAAPPIARLAQHPAQKHLRTKLPRLQSEQQTTDDERTLYLQLSSFCPNRQNLNAPRTPEAIARENSCRDSAGCPAPCGFFARGGCLHHADDGWPILTSCFSTLGWEAKMPAEQSHPYNVIPSAVAGSRSESATQSRDLLLLAPR